ncbi:SH3 domain-containing protein [Granulicoccus sp. GXG6511]|uniref:SH3 domain-containing protein n=1 Tax=Granulicoccus sp. GXG6511 TaxID=3381351 RepID=UPI003D7EE5BA
MITTFGAVASVAYSASATADPFTVRANSGLNVRSGPGLGHAILGALPTGARVDSTGPSQNGWMPITFRGRQGWVSDAYLTAVGAGNTPSGEVPAERGTAYTTAALNVRTGAGLSFRVVTVLARGTRVETTGVETNGYSQIAHAGSLRWVSTRYLNQSAPSTPQPAGPGLPAITSTATATADLLVRTTSGAVFDVIETVPAGSTLQLTGVTENGRTQVVHEGQVAWVNSLYLSGSANVPKPPTAALPDTIGTKYATTALMLRSSPDDQFTAYGDAPAGSALQVTGRVINGRAEVVWNGTVRWVTAQYLRDTPPTTNTGTSGPSKFNLPGLTPNARNLLAQIEAEFPEARTIYGVRQDPLPDHPSGRALDIMVYTNADLGGRIANWTQENARSLNVEYVIWNQRIWSVARSGEGWRYMADRGSITANHRDHVHITVVR